MSLLLLDLNIWSTLTQQPIGITGWQDKTYRPNGAHAQGRALDLRISDLHDVDGLIDHLERRDWPYLYGPPDHKNHIHVQTDGICRTGMLPSAGPDSG
jgi:hypothetical protein